MNFFKNRPLALCCFSFLFVYFISFYVSSLVKLLIAVVAVAIGVVFLRKRILVFFVSLFVVAACVLGYFYYDVYVTKASRIQDVDNARFEISDISFRNDSIAYLDAVDEDGFKIHCTMYEPPAIKIGDVITADISYKEIEPSDDFDIERYYNSRNIWIEGELNNAEIIGHNDNRLRNMITSVHNFCTDAFDRFTNENTAAILAALSIGDRSDLDESVERDFRRAGLSHMLAISGMHLSVIMGCIVMFADLFDLDRRWSSLFIILICICYIFVAGASSSILRAGIMFIIMSLGSVLRRISDSLTNLMVSVTLIILFSPSAVFDTGLILSFTATWGIVVIVGGYMRSAKEKPRGVIGKLWNCIFISILTTLSAYAFSFIPMLVLFDSFSVVSVLSNLLVSPLITIILFCIPLFLAVSRLSFVATGLGCVLDIVMALMLWVINKISAIPNALIDLENPFVPYTFIAIAVGVVLMLIFRKRNAYLMPYLCWFMTFIVTFSVYNINLSDKCDVVMYSEASSDAIVVRNSKGCIYVDLGKGSSAAEDRAFKVIEDEVFLNEVDYWVINNYSNDIVNSVYDRLNECYIRNLYIPYPFDPVSEAASEELEYYAHKENVNVVYYEYNECLTLNNIDIRVYEPIRFTDSSVFIPSVDIACGERSISYVGCGYFDYCDSINDYDILYVGECGTRRKQKVSPHISCSASYVAENNDIAACNIDNRQFEFTDDDCIMKIRISR